MTLLGRVDNIDDILRQTRVLMAPSVWAEARARVVLEAMSRGVPVMASDIGGLPEAKMGVDYLLPVNPVTHYQPSLDSRMVPKALVPPQDIEPWRKALAALVSDRALYEENSRQSRAAATDYLEHLNVLEVPRGASGIDVRTEDADCGGAEETHAGQAEAAGVDDEAARVVP